MKTFPLDVYEQERNNKTLINMEIYQVESNHITQIGYDNSIQKLKVWFNAGQAYDYYEFPESKWELFKNAPSKGNYFKDEIKGKYEYKKL